MEDQCNSGSVEDMEDMFGGGDDAADGVHRRLNRQQHMVVPKVKKRPAAPSKTPSMETTDKGPQSSFLPGTHAVYLKTWGCTHNSSDSEYMAGQLAQQGYR